MSDTPERPSIEGRIELRKGPRMRGPITAVLRLSLSKPIQIAVEDLSTEGFRAQWPNRVRPGDVLWLRLPGITPMEAKVVWSDLKSMGCQFATPLHPAVLNSIVAGR